MTRDELASLWAEESRRSPRDTIVVADVAHIRAEGGERA